MAVVLAEKLVAMKAERKVDDLVDDLVAMSVDDLVEKMVAK
jgi:hypothetical protein